jgi:transposase
LTQVHGSACSNQSWLLRIRHAIRSRKPPTDTATLHQIIAAQAAEGEAREAELAAAKAGLTAKALEVEKLKLQIARLRRMQFGRSSEKVARTIEQLELRLEELEAEEPTPAASDDASAANGEPSSAVEQSSPPDRKKSARRELPAHLPSRDVVHEPSCTSPTCGGEMRKVGEDVTRVLDYIPGHFEVVRHIRPALSCRRCESMVQSPTPSLPIERGLPGAGLLAHILVSKYCDHQPLYRQSGIYAREGVDLDRAIMAAWVGKVTALAAPLVKAAVDHVMTAEKLHADDTPVPVLAPGTGKTKTGRLWVYLRDERPYGGQGPPAVVYRSGRTEARTGLRMMPTSPRSPLSFRTAGFPRYGWKAGLSDGAFPIHRPT